MPRSARLTDTVRASREGHWFHEAWTARKAMQLLLPTNGLIGIAVEGLSEEDQSRASAGTVEIADLTIYYGQDANFCCADRVETLQFKYSPKLAEKPFRASEAKKTIEKFAESYRDYVENHGATAVTEKLFFELITNRPIFPPLQRAIDCIAEGKSPTGDAKKQAEQFERATGLSDTQLVEFASKCQIVGRAGTLLGTETDLRKIIVDWSATADAQAGARLGAMRKMVTKKAGYDAMHQKVIRQVDVLDALGLSDVAELLPCRENLANIEQIVQREQLAEAASLVPTLTKPLIIHANGGVGKTVFLQSLATLLSQQYEVVFFDCFGGGAYRSPEDGRHLPNRGLLHIANVLACRGLCDPILPGSNNTEILFSTFRKRLRQCVKTLTTASPNRKLALFIDAIDNAAEYAKEREQRAFPTMLLESIHLSGPIPGVKVIASARTHRTSEYFSDVPYHDFELHAFTIAETTSYLSSRVADVTANETRVAQSRSEGNARILEHLVTSDRGLLDPSEIDNPIVLDELLSQRIEKALEEAMFRGYKKKEINAFLAGLSVLPPPVPLDEYAGAHGMDIGAIQSFAADLAPLLERTPQGMIFRDEPTETLVRESYGADTRALKRVAKNLLARQADSVYAAQALPALLQKLGEGKKLFKLAFDERFPPTISTTVGQRRIRYARLKAAVLHATVSDDNNSLVRLLVELSTIAASDQRGASYILDNPDLVVNSQDTDALRRLFETRTNWPGSRHARLAIANVLTANLDDASRYFANALEWTRHDIESASDDEYKEQPRPELIDRAAIPFFRLAQGQPRQAIGFMRGWQPWYAFEISEELFELSRQAVRRDPKFRRPLDSFLNELTNEIGLLAGGLSFSGLRDQRQREILGKLGRACRRATKLKTGTSLIGERPRDLTDGLRKAAALAASLGMAEEALSISLRAPHGRPGIWSMVDLHSVQDLFPFLFRIALSAAVKDVDVLGHDILPGELLPLAGRLKKSLTSNELKNRLKQKLQEQIKKEQGLAEKERQIRDEFARKADRFIDYRLVPLLELTRALSAFLGASLRQADKPFQELVRIWAQVRTDREGYHSELQFNHFFHLLGEQMLTFALWARSDLNAASAKFLLKHLHQQDYLHPSTLIEVIATIATRPRFGLIASTQAVQARTLIKHEDDVTTRSNLFAKLARAILPVSAEDAAEYFRIGLDQLDAIGSGDYEFTNELLDFASSIKGGELSQKDFHTFTNICELNMSYEEERFPWDSFATAMSKTSGLRGLAKLSRWHDRGKISLRYTLLPFLNALVQEGKIAPEDALALNRLADPAELWACNSEAFATTIVEASDTGELVTELIRQYEENNPDLASASTVKKLAVIAKEVLGRHHATTKYLSSAHRPFSEVRNAPDEDQNDHPSSDARLGQLPDDAQQKLRRARDLAAATNPLDKDSLRNAVSQLEDGVFSRNIEQEFFRRIRSKVRLADRSKYIRLVANIEEMDSYAIIRELTECRQAWETSSASLDALYGTLAPPILDTHAEDFVGYGRLSTYQLKKVSDLTGVPVPKLTLILVKVFSIADWDVPASAWLGLASIICEDADEGQGQKALEKLLNSSAAQLTSTVVDGPWKPGLYPANDKNAIASGLVWQLLGSPRATDRWRAAHSVRCFARLGRWEAVDVLVRKLPSTDSLAFGAPELPFYCLHARLWLLMALARIAIDYPAKIAKHHKALMKIALDSSHPHIVFRHFATQAVLACNNAGALSLSEKQRNQLRSANDSPFPPKNDGARHSRYDDFYKGRPDDAPKPIRKFTLEYDFDKYYVHGLANVFDQPGWAVKDLMADEAHRLAPTVTSMYDNADREMPYGRREAGSNSSFHVYGQYLAWHALRFVTARLLSQHPITEDREHGEPWSEWLSNKLLTRNDGLWLSDGMDRPPLCVVADVLEKGTEGLVLTGNRDKLMNLVGIDRRRIKRDLVVNGDWKSPDGTNVHISSALVKDGRGRKLAKALLEEKDAFSIWLPTLDSDEDDLERFSTQRPGYRPWIIRPDTEGEELDRFDPLSGISANRRPRFAANVVDHYLLKPSDAFQRTWLMPRNQIAATTDAWNFGNPKEDRDETGVRLVCKTKFLSDVLQWKKADLVLLVKLSRYEEGNRFDRGSRFSNTVAVLRIDKELRFEYFAGPVNQIQ